MWVRVSVRVCTLITKWPSIHFPFAWLCTCARTQTQTHSFLDPALFASQNLRFVFLFFVFVTSVCTLHHNRVYSKQNEKTDTSADLCVDGRDLCQRCVCVCWQRQSTIKKRIIGEFSQRVTSNEFRSDGDGSRIRIRIFIDQYRLGFHLVKRRAACKYYRNNEIHRRIINNLFTFRNTFKMAVVLNWIWHDLPFTVSTAYFLHWFIVLIRGNHLRTDAKMTRARCSCTIYRTHDKVHFTFGNRVVQQTKSFTIRHLINPLLADAHIFFGTEIIMVRVTLVLHLNRGWNDLIDVKASIWAIRQFNPSIFRYFCHGTLIVYDF